MWRKYPPVLIQMNFLRPFFYKENPYNLFNNVELCSEKHRQFFKCRIPISNKQTHARHRNVIIAYHSYQYIK